MESESIGNGGVEVHAVHLPPRDGSSGVPRVGRLFFFVLQKKIHLNPHISHPNKVKTKDFLFPEFDSFEAILGKCKWSKCCNIKDFTM
ncbi:hypothetical protein [Geobacillus sp. CCR]